MEIAELLKLVEEYVPTEKDVQDMMERLRVHNEECERRLAASACTHEFLNRTYTI